MMKGLRRFRALTALILALTFVALVPMNTVAAAEKPVILDFERKML